MATIIKNTQNDVQVTKVNKLIINKNKSVILG